MPGSGPFVSPDAHILWLGQPAHAEALPASSLCVPGQSVVNDLCNTLKNSFNWNYSRSGAFAGLFATSVISNLLSTLHACGLMKNAQIISRFSYAVVSQSPLSVYSKPYTKLL